MVRIIFAKADGQKIEAEARVGETLMTLGQRTNRVLEGTCEGALACATCHVVLHPEWAQRIPAPTEAEEDMLDCIPSVVKNSRLGCQIEIREDMDGMEVLVP